ncbi:hypothetical protein CORC01_13893, partial [Colletotrichum orchidophilum]
NLAPVRLAHPAFKHNTGSDPWVPATRDPSRFASWRRQPSIRYIVLSQRTL